MSVAEIIEEIPRLTFKERAEIAHAIGFEYDEWDLQMIEDSKPGGKLWQLGEEAWAAHRRGESIAWDWNDGLPQ